MDSRFVEDILSIKEKCLRSILSLAESPIEEKFLFEFLKYLELSLLNQDDFCFWPKTIIDGFTYIRESTDELGAVFTDKIIGIKIYHTSSWRQSNLDSSASKQYKPSPTSRNLEKVLLTSNQFIYRQILTVYPQYVVKIENNTYRLDFAFLLLEENNSGMEIRRKVGIECDGYEYHSSPTSFKKDRTRIRLLNADDWTILQYSGAELNSPDFDYGKEFDKIFKILGFSYHGVMKD